MNNKRICIGTVQLRPLQREEGGDGEMRMKFRTFLDAFSTRSRLEFGAFVILRSIDWSSEVGQNGPDDLHHFIT